MAKTNTWELIRGEATEGDGLLERVAVSGGWLYRSTQWIGPEDENGHCQTTESMCFVPDRGE